jgi:hypothetical protein
MLDRKMDQGLTRLEMKQKTALTGAAGANEVLAISKDSRHALIKRTIISNENGMKEVKIPLESEAQRG